MASSGTPRRGRWSRSSATARHVAVVALGLGLSACAPSFKIGTPPPTDRLGSLTVGTSTPQDVRLALGEPRGSGMARSNTLKDPRRIWVYDHFRGEAGKSGMTILLVFFREDRYDGHLWFSSAQLFEVQQ